MPPINTLKTKSNVLDNLGADHQMFFNDLLEIIPVAVYTCDRYGFIQYFNKAAINLWGRVPETGKDLWCGSWKIYNEMGQVLPLDLCPMAITLKEGRSIRDVEIIVERPDGILLNVLPHPDPLFDENGTLIGAVNTLVDITEHKQTKEANLKLQQYNDHLEEFTYAASHDLQEPLRKIHTYSDFLLNNHNHIDDLGRNYLNKITSSVKKMGSLIKDLLQYSSDTNFADDKTLVPLNIIIEEVKNDLDLLIQKKSAKIYTSDLPVIKANSHQMERLFYNLIINAIKFSKPGIDPVIHIQSKEVINETGRRYFLIEIADNGIGFESEFNEKIFKLFQRLHNLKEYSGNGIGLALCKKIVENHRGTITAASNFGNGATFSISLPAEVK